MKKAMQFFAGFLLLNLLWLAASLLLDTRALPNPHAVYARLGGALSAELARHAAASLFRVLAGMLLSLAVGLPLGLLMAGSARADRVLRPLVYFSYPVPKTALLPVAMLLLGLGEGSKLLIMTLTTIFQIVVAARGAAQTIDPACLQVAVSAGLGRRSILRHITLPAILPELFTALRVGAGTSLAILLIVEAYGTRAGLGYFILDAWSRISYVEMYCGVAALSILGAALFLGLDLLAHRFLRWKPADNRA